MQFILKALIGNMGWVAVMKAVWKVGRPLAVAAAKKTATNLDDNAILAVDAVLESLGAQIKVSGLDDRKDYAAA